MTTEEFRSQMIGHLREFIPNGPEERIVKWFEERTYYTGGDFDDDKKLFADLKDLIGDATTTHQIPDNIFFSISATPPVLFANVTSKIVKNGLGKKRMAIGLLFIYEKPFGQDLASAQKLNSDLLKLIKKTVGRSTASIIIWAKRPFRTFWSSVATVFLSRSGDHIDHVQITVAEKLGAIRN